MITASHRLPAILASNPCSVVLLSGGVDSMTVLAYEMHAGRNCLTLSIDYGQRHRCEVNAAEAIAAYYGVPWQKVVLPTLAHAALTGFGEVPKGLPPQDSAQSATVVPGRNLLLISVAVSIATGKGIGRVLFGATADDAAIYPDCQTSFVMATSEAVRSAYGVEVIAPFLATSKVEVVRLAHRLGVPLGMAWSCYDPQGESPCGLCGACLARGKAEELAWA